RRARALGPLAGVVRLHVPDGGPGRGRDRARPGGYLVPAQALPPDGGEDDLRERRGDEDRGQLGRPHDPRVHRGLGGPRGVHDQPHRVRRPQAGPVELDPVPGSARHHRPGRADRLGHDAVRARLQRDLRRHAHHRLPPGLRAQGAALLPGRRAGRRQRGDPGGRPKVARVQVAPDLAALGAVEQRVLWLATAMVHHANRVRPNATGVKVGGHQASSASVVSIMTALWFGGVLTARDAVSVKPHASPVLHAINYLLGSLPRDQLSQLRAFGGLQSYPSRVKDPDAVDYSTGSVGIGATATIWGALAHRYLAGHVEVPVGGRHVAIVGDAELDEGAVWEALVDPLVARLGEVLWIVDFNRQSLDRVVPVITADRLSTMFEAAGWHVVVVKYGRLL